MQSRASFGILPRCIAVAGAVGIWSAAIAAQDPGKAGRPAPGAKAQQPAIPLEKRIDSIGPELTGEMIAIKERLAAQDNIPGGLRGPGPVNDLCTGAIDLATLGFAPGASITVAADNTTATADAAPACGFTATQGSGSVGIWYKFTGTGNYVEFSTCQQATDMTIRFYCGDCAGLICKGADDDGCVTNSLGSRLGICSVSGVQYFALLARYGTVTVGAPFSFSVVDNGAACTGTACSAPPANDECANAQVVAIGSTTYGNNAAATAEGSPPPACNTIANQGVWFKVTGNGSILRATTCGSTTGSNNIVAVYTGACGALTCVGNNATLACAASPRDDTATVDWVGTNGADYFVRVSNDANGSGDFALSLISIGQPATNDTCATAITVALPSSTPGNNIGSTNESPAPPTCSALTGFNNGVWYKFTGNGNRVSVSTCDPATSLDTRVYVYTTPDCVNYTCVAANATAAPACAAPANAATVTFCGLANQVYYVLVTNEANTATGTFQLVVSDQGPSNCIPTGACCTGGGSCAVTTHAACAGSYLGDGTACNPGISTPNLAVPDNVPAGVSSTIVIPAGGPTITDLNVSIIMTHTYQGDLRFTLTHVDTATTVVLIDRPGVPQDSTVGFANDNFGNPTTSTPFTFDDSAASLYDSLNGPNCAINGPCTVAVGGVLSPTGTWKPEQPLAAFNGQSISGTWVLNVSDNAGIDTGTLNRWSLDSTPSVPTPCPSGPDCFTRGPAGALGSGCALPILTHTRSQNAGHFTRGGADGAGDAAQCIGDWDGDGCVAPADVAGFVTAWFFSAQNPGNLDGDIDCDAQVVPADVATFVQHWFGGLTSPATEGCV